jgi:hypothetical protein
MGQGNGSKGGANQAQRRPATGAAERGGAALAGRGFPGPFRPAVAIAFSESSLLFQQQEHGTYKTATPACETMGSFLEQKDRPGPTTGAPKGQAFAPADTDAKPSSPPFPKGRTGTGRRAAAPPDTRPGPGTAPHAQIMAAPRPAASGPRTKGAGRSRHLSNLTGFSACAAGRCRVALDVSCGQGIIPRLDGGASQPTEGGKA